MRGLYAIVDGDYLTPAEMPKRLQQVLDAGCRIIQYRDKQAGASRRYQCAVELQALCQRAGASFIVNDDLELAQTLNCGVHLGSDDSDIAAARQLLGNEAIIGASCYNQLPLAKSAVKNGASYIAFGAFFNSSTKPDAVVASLALLQQAQSLTCPIVAIGGITPDNSAALVAAGADMLAVISDLWLAEDLSQQVQRYQQLFI
jgi:thiamine-phosphate pyrophosphorylase